MNLKQTPLYPVYAEYGEPRMVEFAGWSMPVQFAGIQKEHQAVREHAGLFDVSHMGEFLVEGADSAAFLQFMTTNDVTKLKDGKCQYSFLCYPDGGVVDDLLIYRLSKDRYMLVVNAANIEKDFRWLQEHLPEGDVTLRDISEETALLALQGPAAAAIVRAAGAGVVAELAPFRFLTGITVGGVACLVSRTGYTGEDGFEFYVPAGQAVTLWRTLMRAGEPFGLCPAGLGARDTLRFEACLPLYGQELSPSISPLEAGQGMFVKADKGDFIGREALIRQLAEGVPRKLAGIEMVERGIPRSRYEVRSLDGEKIGEVTSGTQSPTLKKNIGLALIASGFAEIGTPVHVDIRGKLVRAEIVPTPFIQKKRGGQA